MFPEENALERLAGDVAREVVHDHDVGHTLELAGHPGVRPSRATFIISSSAPCRAKPNSLPMVTAICAKVQAANSDCGTRFSFGSDLSTGPSGERSRNA